MNFIVARETRTAIITFNLTIKLFKHTYMYGMCR